LDTTVGEIELEDVIYSKDVLIGFMEYLFSMNISYLLEFALDAGAYAEIFVNLGIKGY